MDVSISKYTIELDQTEIINFRFILDCIIQGAHPSGQLREIAHDFLEEINEVTSK